MPRVPPSSVTLVSVIAGLDPPLAVFDGHQPCAAVNPDNLEPGDPACACCVPPMLIDRPRTGPSGHRIPVLAGPETGRLGADHPPPVHADRLAATGHHGGLLRSGVHPSRRGIGSTVRPRPARGVGLVGSPA